MLRKLFIACGVVLVAICATLPRRSGWDGLAHAAYYPPAATCNSYIAVNQTTSTDLHTFTNNAYICAILLISATQQQLSLVDGTGTVCATNTAALIGGTSASAAVAANGGWGLASDVPLLKSTSSAYHLCLLQSGTGNVSGFIAYSDST